MDSVLDANRNTVMVGDWVTVGPEPEDRGEVITISDPDGDIDDEGRAYGISPSVGVQFNDCDDSFPCTCDYEGRWFCDDIEKVEG